MKRKMGKRRKRKIVIRLTICMTLVAAIIISLGLLLKKVPGANLHKQIISSENEIVEIESNDKTLHLLDKTVNYLNKNNKQLKVKTPKYELTFTNVTKTLDLDLNVSYKEESDYQGYVVDLKNYSNKDQLVSLVYTDTSKLENITVNKYYQSDNQWVKTEDVSIDANQEVLLFGRVFGSIKDLPSFMNIAINEAGKITVFDGLITKSRDEAIISINDGKVTANKEGRTFIDIYDNYGVDVVDSVEVYVTKNYYAPAVEVKPQEGLTIIDGVLIVNKKYSLPSNYNPGLNPTANKAFELMRADAAKLGLNIWNQSNFRSYQYQEQLYNSYVEKDGQEKADTYSARPGYSEHQTGFVIDMNTITDAFGKTKEGKWIKDNCHKYGFIVRYPQGKENITGYKYEPWHIRYLGVEMATAIYDSGLTLEEYLKIN